MTSGILSGLLGGHIYSTGDCSMRLTVKTIDSLLKPGDQDKNFTDDLCRGLNLKVTKGGTGSWVLRYQLNGKRQRLGLGSCSYVSLAEARELANHYKKLVSDGINPIEMRKHEKEAASHQAKTLTFRELSEAYINEHTPEWKSKKHASQWKSTMEKFAYPVIGDMSPELITTDHVLKILKPIWSEIRETATRTRNRIETIWDSGRARGLYTGDNPARWKGHLELLLPKRKQTDVTHFAAMPWQDVPSFWREINTKELVVSRAALMMVILTAKRSSEVVKARWEEFDLEQGLWVIPKERMKIPKEHVEPLSTQSIKLLQSVRARFSGQSEFVFISYKDKALSTASVLKFMKPLGLTVHGFRSSFRDWVAEETHFSNDVAEKALAHAVGNKVEEAYKRSDLREKRREMMQAWANFVTGQAS